MSAKKIFISEKSFEWTGQTCGHSSLWYRFLRHRNAEPLCPKYVSERAGERPFRERVSLNMRET